MTLNLSPCSIFPMNPSEDDLVSSMWIANSLVMEGITEKNGESLCKPRRFNWEIEDSFNYGIDSVDKDACEPIENDIVDLLPSDPFGMDLTTTFTTIAGTTFTAIAGWLEDFEAESSDDYQFLTGLDLLWVDDRLNSNARLDGRLDGKELGDGCFDGGFVSVLDVEGFLGINNEDDQIISRNTEGSGSCSHGDGGAPHEGLFFTLSYLDVRDLLAVERVCRSLRSTVQNDPLLWRCIHIDEPLRERITDNALLGLTRRAQGSLQCLSLAECPRITDDGLKRVLESNPRLAKLSIPRCTRLSVEGIVNNLKAFKSLGVPGIKHLRIGGLYGITYKHFEELKLLLNTDRRGQPQTPSPRFFHTGHLSCDDDRAIDLEMCPRCQNLRIVYDCPMEGCQGKQQPCRACTFCIARCVQCGRCINDSEYEETFCLDLLCLGCWKQIVRYQERPDEKGGAGVKPTVMFRQEMRYRFHLYC